MSIPEQVRKQSEAVEELYKQLSTDTEEETSDEPTETSTAAEQAKPTEDENSETYAQKWRTLQGMYNAEVPRLHQQNREMTQRLQQMEQLLASLSSQQAAPQPVDVKLLTEDDEQEYGDSINIMRKVSREELGAVASRIANIEQALQQVQTNVVPQVQNIARQQTLTAEQQFWSDLARLVPNFREVNSDKGFQAWLMETDPLSGISRQTYLADAQRRNDANRVANFFHTWTQLTGKPTELRSSRPTSELEKQVAPGRSRGANTSAAAGEAKVYTPKDIEKFFDDVRQGKYKGREQERNRIERDIFAAQRENRIRMSA